MIFIYNGRIDKRQSNSIQFPATNPTALEGSYWSPETDKLPELKLDEANKFPSVSVFPLSLSIYLSLSLSSTVLRSVV